jgi:acetyl esterase
MPIDPHVKRFLDTLAAMNPAGALTLTVQERRVALQRLLGFSGRGEAVGAVEDRTLPGPDGAVGLRVYTPAAARAGEVLPGLIYFHGGGFVAGSLDTHDPVCRSLTNASGCRVLSVDYRLAPEHPFPAAIADGNAATAWIAAHASELAIDPDRLGLCGDSAGATLAAVVCQMTTAARQVRVACQFLLCPIMDCAAESESRVSFVEGFLVDRAMLEHDLKHYLPADADRTDPRISPLRAPDLGNLPPTCVHTGEFDPLRDEGRAYVERLQGAGINTIFRCHPGMIHLFYGMRTLIPYADTAFKLMGADIRSLLMSERRRGKRMTDRLQVERLVRELHAARVDGDLEGLCRVFSRDARLRIGGSGDGKRISLDASGMSVIRPWLSVLVKTFKLSRYQLLSLTVEGMRAAVHWRVDIHSKITGAIVPTELMDLIEVSGGRVASLTEFFVPC